jgi:hypothetical protein
LVKVIPLNNTAGTNLKKVIRDNNIFATKGAYYTHILDFPVDELFVLLDGKVHKIALNLPMKPGMSKEPVSEGLVQIIRTLQNLTSSK